MGFNFNNEPYFDFNNESYFDFKVDLNNLL